MPETRDATKQKTRTGRRVEQSWAVRPMEDATNRSPGKPRNAVALDLYPLTALTAPLSTPALRLPGGIESPFMFTASTRAGTGMACLLITIIIFGPFIKRNWRTLIHSAGSLRSSAVLLTTVSMYDMAIYGLAAQRIDLSTSVVIMELHPLGVIFLSLWMDRGGNLYRKNARALLVLIPACTLSLVLLTAAEAGGISQAFTPQGEGRFDIPLGFTLAFVAAAMISCSALFSRWAHQTAWKMEETLEESVDHRYLVVMCMTGTFGVVCLTGAGGMFAIAGALHEDMGAKNIILTFLICGTGLYLASSITWRVALALTDNMAMNAILYFNAPLALIAQWGLGMIHVASTEYLVLGTSGIIGANLAVNLGIPQGRKLLTGAERTVFRHKSRKAQNRETDAKTR